MMTVTLKPHHCRIARTALKTPQFNTRPSSILSPTRFDSILLQTEDDEDLCELQKVTISLKLDLQSIPLRELKERNWNANETLEIEKRGKGRAIYSSERGRGGVRGVCADLATGGVSCGGDEGDETLVEKHKAKTQRWRDEQREERRKQTKKRAHS